MATLFIADLHLSEDQTALNRQFLAFLQGPASQAEALYILGDLFEAWLGDDLIPDFCQPFIQALHNLHRQDVPVYLQHGNRDFLLGETFCTLSGTQLLDDAVLIDLYGIPTLLMHGDLLCTDDIDYQNMRAQLRNPAWIADFLAKPPAERIAMARALREHSKLASSQKSEQIMDVNLETVRQTLRQHELLQLIHGHTHRPAQHRLDLDGKTAWRHVLPDWQSQPGLLYCDTHGCQLRELASL
ncbi:MAG: UDP-2,3-diacylglucosamine diphosphatase [Thiohalomonadaceae bacterium]